MRANLNTITKRAKPYGKSLDPKTNKVNLILKRYRIYGKAKYQID